MTPNPLTKLERSCLKEINKDPILKSLLYELNLLPEQLKPESGELGHYDDLICICEHWILRFNTNRKARE